jgi:hypothetical protein
MFRPYDSKYRQIQSPVYPEISTIADVRVKKFCATTQFDAEKVLLSGFKPPYTLSEGLDRTIKFEFVNDKKDDLVFISE